MPSIVNFVAKEKKNFDLEHTVKIQHSQLGDHVLQTLSLNSRLKNDTHSGWCLVLIRTLLGRPGLQCLVSNYILAGRQVQIFHEPGQRAGEIGRRFPSHKGITPAQPFQAGRVPRAAAAGTHSLQLQPAPGTRWGLPSQTRLSKGIKTKKTIMTKHITGIKT